MLVCVTCLFLACLYLFSVYLLFFCERALLDDECACEYAAYLCGCLLASLAWLAWLYLSPLVTVCSFMCLDRLCVLCPE